MKGFKYYIVLLKLLWKTRKYLKSNLNPINSDIVISVGQWEKILFHLFYGKWKPIREFHFSRFYRDNLKYLKNNYIDKCFKTLISFFEILILKQYDKIVILTKEDKLNNWKKWRNICVIPNPFPIHIVTNFQFDSKKEYFYWKTY